MSINLNIDGIFPRLASLEAMFPSIGNPNGSGQVGFQQGGTGAVPRTVESKLKERVSILDFGGVKNNPSAASDNLVAMNRAIKYVFDNGGGEVLIPSGDFYFRRVENAVTPDQSYIIPRKGVYITGEGKDATSVVRYGPHSLFTMIEGEDNTDISIRNLTLDGNPGVENYTNFAANLSYVASANGVVFANVRFKDVPGLHAIDINGSKNIFVYGCEFIGNNSALSVEFGGATYYPESIQISKNTTGTVKSDNVVVENCVWGPSENYTAPFAAIGNHSGGGFVGYNASRVRVRNCVAKGMLKYFVRPFCFDDVLVEDVRFTETVGTFAFICGSTTGGVITASNNISLRRIYHDGDDSFVRTDANLITHPSTARYTKLTIDDCEVVGRSAVNAINLHYFDDVTVDRLKCDGAARGFNGTAISNLKIRNPSITNSAVSGVEIIEPTGDGAGQYLNKNLNVTGGRIVESQYYSVNMAAPDGFLVQNVDVTGSSKLAATRGAVIITAAPKQGKITGLIGRTTANTNQPLYAVTVTSGTDVVVDDINVYCTGPAVLNSATGTSHGFVGFGWRTAAPTTGTWKQGFIIWNQAPAVGSARGWVCTVAGTPGTWVSMGNL